MSLELALLGHADRCRRCRVIGEDREWSAHRKTDAVDPDVWSGRALQEDLVELAVAVLHQCIRPLIGACCAPGHHGYQRACDLINGQASTGHLGHQYSHAPGRPNLHFVSSSRRPWRVRRIDLTMPSRAPHLSALNSRWTIKQLGQLR